MEHAWHIVGDLWLLLVAALLAGMACEWLKQNAILGYLLAGMLLGPGALGWVKDDEAVKILAEVGVALLLFAIGLEFSWKRLTRIGGAAFGLGVLQVGVTTVAAGLVAMAMGLSVKAAVVVGGAIALSSTAFVLRVLLERAEVDSQHGRLVLAVLLFQDLAAVLLILLVSMLGASGGLGDLAYSMGRAAVFVLLLFGGFFVINRYIVGRLLDATAMLRNRELLILIAVAIAIGASWSAHKLHLSPVLGAFVAGVLLGDSPLAIQVRGDVSALRALFVTVFFTSMGMLGDPAWAIANVGPVLACVFAILVGKALIVTFAGAVMGLPWKYTIAAGICLAQVGEFTFVLAEEAVRSDLITDYVFRLVITSTIVTMALTPYMVAAASPGGAVMARQLQRVPWPSRFLRMGLRTSAAIAIEEGDAAQPPAGDAADPPPRAIIVGFGPAGQGTAEALRSQGAHVVIVEISPRSAELARAEGYEVHQGDMGTLEMHEHLHLHLAKCLVVTIPDHRAACQIIRHTRLHAPHVAMIARARYHVYANDLTEAGAHVVIDEEQQTGKRLGAAARVAMS